MKAIALSALACALMHGASFDVASIRPCPPGTREPATEHSGQVQFVLPGGNFRAQCTSVQFLIEWSYNIQPVQHAGGGEWIGMDRFDVVAKAETEASEENMREMVKTLLADRFHLRLHEEQRITQTVLITAGKTPSKLFPSKPEATHAMRMEQRLGLDGKTPVYRVLAQKYTMDQVADVFGRQLGKVMVNETGLKGAFDFELELQPDASNPNPRDAALLITAMREQLGLTLRSERVPVRFLLIESADKSNAED